MIDLYEVLTDGLITRLKNDLFKLPQGSITLDMLDKVTEGAIETLGKQHPELLTKDFIDKAGTKIFNTLRNEFTTVDFSSAHVSESKSIKYRKISKEDIFNLNKDSYYWNRYKKFKSYTRTESFINSQSRDVDRILQLMPSPLTSEKESFISLGMVIGDVQAGKTGNYSVLINKAADLGYKLIIVLTGMTENLRSQTQKRLDEDFIGATSEAGKKASPRQYVGVSRISSDLSKLPLSITDQNNDFSKNAVTNFSIASIQSPVVIVTKKHSTILSNMIEFLSRQNHGEGIAGKITVPTLIIDDESDNASVDTAKEDEDPKQINRKIRLLVKICKQVSYIAYTATPYANIFIDPDRIKVDSETGIELIDLYPRDFIVALKAPTNYCGGDFFYSDDDEIKHATYVKHLIDDAGEVFPLNHQKNDPVNFLPNSLKKAIYEYFLAIAIKSIRRKAGIIPDYDIHDSMLINVSRFTDYQNEVFKLVDNFVTNYVLNQLFNDIENEKEGTLWFELKKVYLNHYFNVAKVPETWSKIKSELIELSQINNELVKVIAIHSQSNDVLEYTKTPARYIAIGGFKLSRGLTLEGLTVSYFYRRSIMYDTLMQMARWFGYRDGYQDLIRLYTTCECATWYQQINKATVELKEYLLDMERQKKEPRDFGVKVRSTEAALLVTARNKMRATDEIELELDFSGSCNETFYVDPRPDIAKYNLEISSEFVGSIASEFKQIKKEQHGNGYIAKNVQGNLVEIFLRKLNLHTANTWVRGEALVSFIMENIDSAYPKWDIALLDVIGGKERHSLVKGLEVGIAHRTTSFKRDMALPANFKDDIKYKLPLGDNGRVSSNGMEATGLYKEDLFNSGIFKTKNSKTKRDDQAARRFRAERNMNPLLVLQIVNVSIKQDIEVLEEKKHIVDLLSEQNTHLAVYISLPGKGKTNVKKYRVNRNFVKEYYGEVDIDD